jgi:uncharacterized 2Fe-2S/4Fe-4S cluster protein (DUF4445 family)
MSRVTITIHPENKKIEAEAGQNLMSILRRAGVNMEFPCGGCGTCGRCRVKILSKTPHPKEEELMLISTSELEKGVRLACLCDVSSDMDVELLFKGKKGVVLETGFVDEFNINPPLKKVFFRLTAANRTGVPLERQLEDEVGYPLAPECRLELLQIFSGTPMREGTAIIRNGRITGIEAGNTASLLYGVAVDIGTTTVVVSLVNLSDGREEAVVSDLNPQIEFGQDVLARISFAAKGRWELERLKNLIIEAINGLINKVSARANISPRYIYEVSVAANPTMTHLFLGINPETIGSAPYNPVLNGAIYVKAGELGINISPFGMVYCLPAISGYVGADITAGIMATGMYKKNEKSLLMDIGTNGELVLFDGQKLFACSSPAGPALEGVNISCGMRAAPGAIEEVRIIEDVSVKTIGGEQPAGLCGSGIIDLISELLKAGVIDSSGKLSSSGEGVPEKIARRIFEKDGKTVFKVTEAGENSESIYLTARDIRQVQLAKGAIWAGITALLEQNKLGPGDIDRIYVAGAFGAHLRTESLIGIGMAAEEWEGKILFVGNTSKTGAMMCLLSEDLRCEAEKVAGNVNYIELSMLPGFERIFTKSLKFPERRNKT